MANDVDIQKLIDKVKDAEKGHQLDLSSGEDLSIGIMNLVSLEEHLFFTAKKTGDNKYWAMLDEIRLMRVALMKKIVKDPGGEVWCISKHLLAASMRMMEVGTKDLKKGDKKEAGEMFEKAYQLYNMFWGINLGLIDGGNLDKVKDRVDKDDDGESERDVVFTDEEGREIQGKASMFAKIGEIIKKAVDCCRE